MDLHEFLLDVRGQRACEDALEWARGRTVGPEATLSPAQRRILVTLFRRGRLRRGELLRRARAATADLRSMRVRGTLSFLGLVDVDVSRRWFFRDPGWRAIRCANISSQLCAAPRRCWTPTAGRRTYTSAATLTRSPRSTPPRKTGRRL